jgi:hypothetical protein
VGLTAASTLRKVDPVNRKPFMNRVAMIDRMDEYLLPPVRVVSYPRRRPLVGPILTGLDARSQMLWLPTS